jgi:hypothetical protein
MDRRLLAFYPAAQPVHEVAVGDAGVVPHAVVEKTLTLSGMINVDVVSADDVDNWAPTGYADAGIWRVSFAESNVKVTGMIAGRPGEIRTLLNVGGENFKLAQFDIGSSTGNQLVMPNNFATILATGGSATFIYDPPIPGIQDFGYWRLIAAPGAEFSNT